jgi:SAM-dependent methyltransferase
MSNTNTYLKENQMDRLGILNSIATKNNVQSYLEIGVANGYTLKGVICKHKIGVDPDKNSAATLFITSDEFFKNNKETFDLIFIDGLHHADQVKQDIYNALSVLNKKGVIICHDMNPYNEIMQRVPRQSAEWTGDCWKAWVELRASRDDLSMQVVDTDYGCGVIFRGKQELINVDCELSYENLEKNRKYWLNLITIQQFLDIISKEVD